MSVDPTTLRRVQLVQDAALALEQGKVDGRQAMAWIESIRLDLFELSRVPSKEVAVVIRLAMRYVGPLALVDGPRSRKVLFVVDDPAMLDPNASRYAGDYVAVDFNRLSAVSTEGWEVLAAFHQLSPAELVAIPRIRVERSDNGPGRLLWNAHNELADHQRLVAYAQPFLCGQYARHISDWWKSTLGRRAEVHVSVDVAVLPYRATPLVDRKVDLSTAAWRLFSRNEWILPFLREIDANRRGVDRADLELLPSATVPPDRQSSP